MLKLHDELVEVAKGRRADSVVCTVLEDFTRRQFVHLVLASLSLYSVFTNANLDAATASRQRPERASLSSRFLKGSLLIAEVILAAELQPELDVFIDVAAFKHSVSNIWHKPALAIVTPVITPAASILIFSVVQYRQLERTVLNKHRLTETDFNHGASLHH